MKTIYLIRHGESFHNAHTMHLVGGRSEDSGLTVRGQEQARLLGERLKNEGIIFTNIYSSTAARAIQTADITCKIINHPRSIIQTEELLEYHHGNWDGRTRSEVYTPELKAYLEENSWNFQPPGGESQRLVAKRMREVLDEVIQYVKPEENSAIFSHGTATKALLCDIMGFHPRHIYHLDLNNTAITELRHDGKKYYVKRINDDAHLKP